MTLYMAVTPDELELPLYVTDSVQSMAWWTGLQVSSVHQMCSRNRKKPPFRPAGFGGNIQSKYRLRKITVEEDE